MTEQISFKARVKQVAIEESKKYKEVFVVYPYLICSKAFRKKDYYILATEFFNKCYNRTLAEGDFDFKKNGKKKYLRFVRRKIKLYKKNRMSLLKHNDI